MDNLPAQVENQADSGIDFTGVGKAMKAVPPAAWAQIVNTACTTFDKTLAPITETAYGIGRLIKAKFDRLIDVEQVLAAESIDSARKKVEKTRETAKTPRPQILLQIIENSCDEVDTGIRELWSNLLAQEMLTQAVHPEVGRVLARISFDDTQLLVKITESRSNDKAEQLFALAVKVARTAAPFLATTAGPFTSQLYWSLHQTDPTTFNHAHLQNLGLIECHDREWSLTPFGEGFIQAVTDPSLEIEPGND